MHSRDVEADPIKAATDLAQTKNLLDTAQAAAQQIIAMTKPGQLFYGAFRNAPLQ